jgi:hypothetical protein
MTKNEMQMSHRKRLRTAFSRRRVHHDVSAQCYPNCGGLMAQMHCWKKSIFLLSFFLLIWRGRILTAVAARPATSPSDSPAGATTLPTSRSSRPSGIAVSLFGDTDSIPELRGRWQMNFDTLIIAQEETITVGIPDGREFSEWSHMTDFVRDGRTVTGVEMWPLPKPEPIDQAKRTLEGILTDWHVQPTGDFARILAEMDDSRPTICGGDRGDMDLSADARLDLDVRPYIGSNPTTYIIVLGVWVSPRWDFEPGYKEAHRVKSE